MIEIGIPQVLIGVIFTLRILTAIISCDGFLVSRSRAVAEVLANAIIIALLYVGGFWSQ